MHQAEEENQRWYSISICSQVISLQERVQSYEKHDFLSFKVCTVDSCQGAEKDILILSTVRHNNGGNIGFLDCDKRTNVALTRAK